MTTQNLPTPKTLQAAAALQLAFETLTSEQVPALMQLYDTSARFKDPFNQVQGHAAIAHIFTHMYRQVEQPRFSVSAVLCGHSQVFMRWDFSFVARHQPQTIHGTTLFELNTQGLVTQHRDYWDAAEELYEKLPLLGTVLRWIKRKLRA